MFELEATRRVSERSVRRFDRALFLFRFVAKFRSFSYALTAIRGNGIFFSIFRRTNIFSSLDITVFVTKQSVIRESMYEMCVFESNSTKKINLTFNS